MTINELSTYPFIINALCDAQNNIENYAMAKFMISHNIRNYGELERYILSGQSEFQIAGFRELMQKAYDSLDRYNALKMTAKVYSFGAYEASGFMPEILEKTDSQTGCEVLPFNGFMSNNQCLKNRLKHLSIKEAKDMLQFYGSNSKNALEFCLPSMGPSKSAILAGLISFYDDQIIRTAATVDDLSTYPESLFLKDQEAKREIVSSYAPQICSYLLNEGQEFIWGKTPKDKKDILLSRISKP